MFIALKNEVLPGSVRSPMLQRHMALLRSAQFDSFSLL